MGVVLLLCLADAIELFDAANWLNCLRATEWFLLKISFS